MALKDSHLIKIKDIVLLFVALLGLYFGFVKDKIVEARETVTQTQMQQELKRAEAIHEQLQRMIAENSKQIQELTVNVSRLTGYIDGQKDRK